ncbi:glucosidase II beta subunit-like protein domain-containing protein [Phthorimaea operculella]|nr:glucosidase II beta subunit-like protein domain-containing protein [Phthorimaea operculella]
MKCSVALLFCVVGAVLCIEHDFKGFDDSILFGINWPGAPSNALDNLIDGDVSEKPDIPDDSGKEVLKVTTSNKETYHCKLPELKNSQSSNIEDYDGPSPINLLKPLISQKICSYRLESYWSYEVCHGRYIRQYHEERDGKQVKTQEFYLGHWKIEKQMKFEADAQAAIEAKEPLKTTKVEGTPLPYVEMVMDEGTICDLSGKPRVTRVLYVCYTHGKHEVYSFKETSTCEYEIIILSPLLCAHPQFKPKEVSENIIDCIPVGDSPKKPRNLLKQEVESMRLHQQSIRLMSNNDPKENKDFLAVLKLEKVPGKDGETTLKFELRPLDEDGMVANDETPSLPGDVNHVMNKGAKPVITDDSPVRSFLNGENCLNGGTGWWKYEFCYGKHVVQYHVDRTGEKTTLLLGKFDEAAHLEWIKENKGKAPKSVVSNDHVSRYHTTPLYEFCYGKHVVQYHVDRTGEKTTLLLGKFDEAAHLEWIKENKGKAPKSVVSNDHVSRYHPTLFYDFSYGKHVVQYHVDRTGEKTTLLLGKFDEAAHLEWIKENKGKAPKNQMYEFCYGKHVVQYHVDRTGEKTTLLLGKFDEAAHLEWIKENKGKAPKSVDRTGEKTTLLLGKFDEAAHLEWIKENKGKAPKSVGMYDYTTTATKCYRRNTS